MSILVQAEAPPPDKTTSIQSIALGLAGLYAIMATLQLYAFEKFVPLIESFWLPGGRLTGYLVAVAIVVSEVMALPYLLRLHLSPAMRFVSMVLSFVVPLVWMWLSVWLMLTVNVVANLGVLGVELPVPPGWWAPLFMVAVLILAVWVAWGRWPLRTKPATK